MLIFKHDDAEIHCEVHGRGFPLLLFAPGGLRSRLDYWKASPADPGETMRARDPSIAQATIDSFGCNMFSSDFVFSVSRDFVKGCRTPLFLQPGTDKPHPAETSAEVAALAPNVEIQKDWRGPQFLDESIKRVRAFLERNMPK